MGLRAGLVAGLALAACGFLVPAASGAGGLPPVAVSYAGEFHETVDRTAGSPETVVVNLKWTSVGSSGGQDGALPLTYTSMSGSVVTEYQNGCKEYDRTYSLPHVNPFAGGWGLNENSDYPARGWKYIVSAPLHFQQVHESAVITGCKGSGQSFTSEPPEDQSFEIKGLVNEARADEQLKQYEPIEAQPGVPTSVTHEFNSNETVTCSCLPDPTHVQVHLKLTISVTSPAPGNIVEPPPTKGKSGPPGSTPSKKRSEKRRRELKEQARADLKPALEEDWAAHGLSAGAGLATGLALSEVANELGQKEALFAGNDANLRAINDYRIVKDPPDRIYHAFAKPRAAKVPALPSCKRFQGGDATYCTTLRAAGAALLFQSGQAAAIDKALYTTISRDTAAINARRYGAAEEQARHFRVLHARFEATLRAQGKAGAQVAALLRTAQATGIATQAQSASAITSVERELSKAGIGTAAIGGLAGSALVPKETNLLDVLGKG
jgi:hypothetical protein